MLFVGPYLNADNSQFAEQIRPVVCSATAWHLRLRTFQLARQIRVNEMFRNDKKTDELKVSLGAHGVELVPCSDTPQLAGLTTHYTALKNAIEHLEDRKKRVGHLRGTLDKKNQHRSTASETSVFGAENVSRLYAFAVVKAEYDLAIVHVENARTALGEYLGTILPPNREPNWNAPTTDIPEKAPHALRLIARHNIASAIALLSWLRKNMPGYREYERQLPDFVHVLSNAYQAHCTSHRYEEVWKVLVYGE